MATQQHHEEQPMSLEQIEAHVKEANLEQYEQPQAGTRGAVGAEGIDLAAQLKKVCGIYRGIRPILGGVIAFPLIPGSIKNPLRTFMSVMDVICPA